MFNLLILVVALSGAAATFVSATSRQQSDASLEAKVGPQRGTIIAEGGFATSEIYARFIEAAGGAEALIIDVPTANLGEFPVRSDTRQTLGLKAAGAKNLLVLHTTDRNIANSDSFVEPIRRAAGVWIEGGQPSRLVDVYAATKAAQEIREVLSRGGVVGGLSAGAVILASHLPQDGTVPLGYERGFGFLQSVAIEPHVVAREWLESFAEWLKQKPDLLGMAVDEGTAWVIRGDTAEVLGRGKAFIYGGADSPDPGKPFLTLRPGDQYNLAARRVSRRAIEGSALTENFVDALFSDFTTGQLSTAAVLVAQDGRVLVNKSYNVPEQPKYLPTTTVPYFALGGLSDVFSAIAAQFLVDVGRLTLDETLDDRRTSIREYLLHQRTPPSGSRDLARILASRADIGFSSFSIQQWGSPYGAFVRLRLFGPAGISRTTVDSTSGEFRSNVDELYRWEFGLENPQVFAAAMAPGMGIAARNEFGVDVADRAANAPPPDITLGWRIDTHRGLTRLSAFGTDDGKRSAFVRLPDKRISVIILTDNDDVDAQRIAERITDRLLTSPSPR